MFLFAYECSLLSNNIVRVALLISRSHANLLLSQSIYNCHFGNVSRYNCIQIYCQNDNYLWTEEVQIKYDKQDLVYDMDKRKKEKNLK